MSDPTHESEEGADETLIREELRKLAELTQIPSEADQRIRDRLVQRLNGNESIVERNGKSDSEQEVDASSPLEVVRSKRRRPAWFAVAVAGSVILVIAVLLPSGKAYSFETMLRAIHGQTIVRAILTSAAGGESIGWLRQGSDAVVVVESRERVVWWDEGQQQAREFSRTTRASEPPAVSVLNDNEDPPVMLLRLLASLRSAPADSSNKRDWRVVNESWSKVGELIELRVELSFTSDPSRKIIYVLGLDPQTQIPQWVRIESNGNTSTARLRYPDSGPTSLASLGVRLPANAVSPANAKADMEQVTPEKIASLPKTPTSESPDSPDSKHESEVSAEQDTNPTVATRLAARRWQANTAVQVPEVASEMSERVDQQLDELWNQHSVEPVVHADAYQLTRRLYLDLTGRVPRVNEINQSLEKDPNELVEQLLASRDFSTHMATVWSRLLLPESVDLSQFGGVEAFNVWLAKQFAGNVGYDEIVRQLLLAEGRVGESGPVLFYTALELKPDHLAKQTARVFLGSRIDCAQCHDHPMDDWTQQDFWAYAAFFARISRPDARMEVMSPVLRVRDVPRGDVTIPETDQIVAPRFLGGQAFREQPGEALRRQGLADWMISSRQFARATVNHVWTHFFGVGLVDPADDFGPHNPSVSPELLDELAEFLIASDFNLRELVRVITSTRAYRLTSESDAHSAGRLRYYAQMNTKWLTAEQLYDAMMTAARSTQTPAASDEMATAQMFADTGRAAFVEKFKAPRGSAIDYQAGIPQALSMMNGLLTLQATEAETSGMMKALSAPFFSDTQRVETIFLAVVSRPPAQEELDTILPMLSSAEDTDEKQQVLSDLFWAILNTAEFSTNH